MLAGSGVQGLLDCGRHLREEEGDGSPAGLAFEFLPGGRRLGDLNRGAALGTGIELEILQLQRRLQGSLVHVVPPDQDLAQLRDGVDPQLGHPTLQPQAFIDLVLGRQAPVHQEPSQEDAAAVGVLSVLARSAPLEGLFLDFDEAVDVLVPEVASRDHDGADGLGGIAFLGLETVEQLFPGDQPLSKGDLPQEEIAARRGHGARIISMEFPEY